MYPNSQSFPSSPWTIVRSNGIINSSKRSKGFVSEIYLRCIFHPPTHTWQYSDTFAESFVPFRRKFRNFTNNYRCRWQIVRLCQRYFSVPPSFLTRWFLGAIKWFPRVNVFQWARLSSTTCGWGDAKSRRPTFPFTTLHIPWAFYRIVAPKGVPQLSIPYLARSEIEWGRRRDE